MKFRLAGQVAVVTGAAQGLGAALAMKLAGSRSASIISMSPMPRRLPPSPVEQTAYAASKFAVRGFTDALRHELEGSHIGVSVVHPGGIKTRIAHNSRRAQASDPARADRLADRFFREVKTTPQQAALRIIDGIEKRAPRILIGPDAGVLDWMSRAAPVGYWRLIKRLFKDEDVPKERGGRVLNQERTPHE
jgi:short-subunit dehydrogenase